MSLRALKDCSYRRIRNPRGVVTRREPWGLRVEYRGCGASPSSSGGSTNLTTLWEGRIDMGKICTWESSHAPGGSHKHMTFMVVHHTVSLLDEALMICKTGTVQPVPENPGWGRINVPVVHGSAYAYSHPLLQVLSLIHI